MGPYRIYPKGTLPLIIRELLHGSLLHSLLHIVVILLLSPLHLLPALQKVLGGLSIVLETGEFI